MVGDGRIGVNYALDAVFNIVHIRPGRLFRVRHPAFERDLRSGALAAAALEVADHQTATVFK